jgi:hypothetical protein
MALVLKKVEQALDAANIEHFSGEADGESALIRLTDSELQMRAERSSASRDGRLNMWLLLIWRQPPLNG